MPMLNTESTDIKQIQTSVAEEMAELNRIIADQLASDSPFVSELNDYILLSGGKRVRPIVVLLLTRALGYRGRRHLTLASAIEFIHAATLLHDDVIDNSDTRRSKRTVRQLWGNNASILIGDFLYSRAFQSILDLGSVEIVRILTDTTNTLIEGELMQLANCRICETDEELYFSIIRRKTAVLFESGAHISALLASSPADISEACRRFGHHLGISFQLIDDRLDYSDRGTSGKPAGNDLREGKATLPFIHALAHASPADGKILKSALRGGDDRTVQNAIALVRQSGGLDYTDQKAEHHISQALQALDVIPDSAHKSALRDLTRFMKRRDY